MNQSTKAVLNLLGVFTVSSFHAYICARSPSLLSNLLAGRGASRKRSLQANSSLEHGDHADSGLGVGGASSKSYDEDDDFNESTLIHVRIPGRKVCFRMQLRQIESIRISYFRLRNARLRRNPRLTNS